MLSAPLSSFASGAVQVDNGLKAIECELNAGCLGLLCPESVESDLAQIAADTMDFVLSFQIGLLLIMAAVNNTTSANAEYSFVVPSRKRGRNRRAASLQGLYGRQSF